MQGVVCIPCVLFGQLEASNERGKYTALKSLVKNPFTNYKKIHDKLKAHLSANFHTLAQERSDTFLKCISNLSLEMVNQLDQSHRQKSKENRERLIPIIKTILLIGGLGIALRGHRDDGKISLHQAVSGVERNFRALLAFRVDSGDTVLEEHLKNSSKVCTYVSKTTQNELINIRGEQILKEIIDEVKEAKFFSIFADETTDSAHEEQLCICVRYVDISDNAVKEQFLSFGKVEDFSAASIARQILEQVAFSGLDIANCVGARLRWGFDNEWQN